MALWVPVGFDGTLCRAFTWGDNSIQTFSHRTKKIDTSRWNVAVVDFGSHSSEFRTPLSESEIRSIYEEELGCTLVSFTEATTEQAKSEELSTFRADG